MRLRWIVLVVLLSASGARAGECGPRLDRSDVESLSRELNGSLATLSVYDGALRTAGIELVSWVVREATVFSERVGRVALLAELRDAMRHEGERSFVQFKLSHEASLLRTSSASALHTLAQLKARLSATSIGPDLALLHQALTRAQRLFAVCDSPL